MGRSWVSCRKRGLKIIYAGNLEESLSRHNSSAKMGYPDVKIFSQKLPGDKYAKVLIGEVLVIVCGLFDYSRP